MQTPSAMTSQGMAAQSDEQNRQVRRMAAIVESSEDAILSKTFDDVVTSWNLGAEKLFGYTADEIVGRSFLKLVPQHKLEETKILLGHLKSSLNVQYHETQYLHKNGNLIDVAVTLSAIKNAHDEVIEISEIIRDVTFQKLMQQRFLMERELFKVTLDSIGDAVMTTDNQGCVQYLNPVAEKLTGWTQEEAIGKRVKKILNVISEKTRKPGLNPVALCLAENRVITLADDAVLINRQGDEFAIQESVSPIRDAGGNTLGVVIVFQDVTAQRKISQELSYRAKHDILTGLPNRSEFEKSQAFRE